MVTEYTLAYVAEMTQSVLDDLCDWFPTNERKLIFVKETELKEIVKITQRLP